MLVRSVFVVKLVVFNDFQKARMPTWGMVSKSRSENHTLDSLSHSHDSFWSMGVSGSRWMASGKPLGGLWEPLEASGSF